MHETNEDALRILGRIAEWTNEYGRTLIPDGADTYGEGMRDAKDQVRLLLRSAEVHRPETEDERIAAALLAADAEGYRRGVTAAAGIAGKSPCKYAGSITHKELLCETCNYHRCLAAAIRVILDGEEESVE